MVENSVFSLSQYRSSEAQTSSGRQEDTSTDLNPYINKKARQYPDTFCTVQALGLRLNNQ